MNLRRWAERLAVAAVFGLVALVPARTSEAAEGAKIVEDDGSWELAYGLVYYRVFGKVKNVSGAPLRYVKLQLELLDEDGKVVLERVGYNQKAEALGEQETEGYTETRSFEERLAGVAPIGAGEEDLFRIGLAKDDIPKKPKFTTYRITIVEPEPGASGRAQTPKGSGIARAPGIERININTATEKELMTLPEMNEARAKAILNYRTGNGELIQLEELKLIPQVLPIYEKIESRLALE